MKKALSLALTCLLVFAFMEPSNGQNLTDQQRAVIENQVDSMFHVMIRAAEDLDYDMLSSGVDDRYHAGFIINATYFTRYDSLSDVMKSQAGGVVKQNIMPEKERVTVLSDRLALLTATGDAKVDLTDGRTFTVKFFWSFVYEKSGDTWKVIHSHQSNSRQG